MLRMRNTTYNLFTSQPLAEAGITLKRVKVMKPQNPEQDKRK